MGTTQTMSDGIHAKCQYCGAVFVLPEDQRTASPRATKSERRNDDSFDVGGFISRFMNERGGSIEGVLWGDEVQEKERVARKRFDVKKKDKVFLIFDASRSGRCTKGLAVTSSGVYLRDDDGDNGNLKWDEFDDYDCGYRRGMLVVTNYPITSPDGEPIAELLDDIRFELYGTRSAKPDVAAVVNRVASGRKDEVKETVWGDDVAEYEDVAREYFEITDDEEVYYLLDATFSGSFKKGLALCSTGIFMRDDDKDTGYASWTKFEEWPFSYDGTVFMLDEYPFTTTDGKLLLDVFTAMLDELYEN